MMITFAPHRYAFIISGALALLAGCGGSQPPIGSRDASAHVDRSDASKVTVLHRSPAIHATEGIQPGRSPGAKVNFTALRAEAAPITKELFMR